MVAGNPPEPAAVSDGPLSLLAPLPQELISGRLTRKKVGKESVFLSMVVILLDRHRVLPK